MKSRKYGVGIIGCGMISGAHARAYQDYSNECEIVAVADVNEEAARRFMAQYEVPNFYVDWCDLLADERIDIVSLCTPPSLHAPMTIAAARAGNHIVCEKPMARTVGEAHEMIEACRANNVYLTIGSERFNPRHHFIKDRVLPLLGEIKFSSIISFHFRDTAYYESAAWRGTFAGEGGAMAANLATYVWDLWQWFLGGLEYSYGYWANLFHPTIEAEDIAYGLVRFKNGSYGKYFATSGIGGQPPCRGLEIIGENGSIHAEDEWCYLTDFSLHDPELNAVLHREFEDAIDRSYDGEYQRPQVADLLAAIQEGRETLVPEAMEALKILNGLHWHGWQHAEKFRQWAQQLDLPATVEAGDQQDWRGGELLRILAAIVRTPSSRLDAPFLGEEYSCRRG